eukprot:100294-Hanusia_phi.AAC.1
MFADGQVSTAAFLHLDSSLLQADALVPFEGMGDYVLHHPIQDVAGIFILYFTINALKAGASLPVAIVAGGYLVVTPLDDVCEMPGAFEENTRLVFDWSETTLETGEPFFVLFSVYVSLCDDSMRQVFGEIGDAGWAPASAILVKALYDNN